MLSPSARVSASPPSTVHADGSSLLGTPNWSVLRECGQEPLQFYWFRTAVKFYNALLCSNSSTLAKVLKADIAMSTINKKCLSADF